MKRNYIKKQLTLLILSLSTTALATDNTKVKLELKKPTVNEGEYLYEIKDNEILVNDKLITLFSFGKKITVSYRNKTDQEMTPKYTLKVYNPYGLLLGMDKVGHTISLFGNSTRMEPGAVSSETIYLEAHPLKEILEFSSIAIPEDLSKKKWMVLSETNTK